MLFVLDGRIEHEAGGLDGRRILGTGDILIVPRPARHVYINTDPARAMRMHTVRLFLDADFLGFRAQKRGGKPESDLSDFILRHFTRAAQISGGIDNEIMQILIRLRCETEGRAIGFRHRVRLLCTDLIVAVARKMKGDSPKKGEPPDSPHSPIISAAKEYIFKHLGQQITLGEIAWHVGKGEEHLARVFKSRTGESVFDWIREMRINKAKTHLLEPGLSLTEIAGRCGFNSLSFFSRTFRRYAGMSPSDYRRQVETTGNWPGGDSTRHPGQRNRTRSDHGSNSRKITSA